MCFGDHGPRRPTGACRASPAVPDALRDLVPGEYEESVERLLPAEA